MRVYGLGDVVARWLVLRLLVERLGCKAWVKDLARSLCFVLAKALYFHSTSDSSQEY